MGDRDRYVVYVDGHRDLIRMLPIDIIRVERQGTYGTSETGLRLAHQAATRAHLTDLDFDSWADSVADIAAPDSDDTEEVDPTRPVPGDSS